MRDYEIIESSEVPQYILDWYKKNGFLFVAKGDAACVFRKGNEVFKVYGIDVNGHAPAPDQQMILLFVAYCKKHSNNLYLPKFGNVRYIDKEKKFLEVQTEILTPGGKLSKALSDYYMYNGWPSEQKYADAAYDIISKIMSDDELKEFINTIHHLLRVGGRKIYNGDINEKNIMMRGKTPVINDPWTLGF
jgi:hypothetical protein